MNKLNLSEEMILEKSFNIDFKGYSPLEVDSFLDMILEDYQSYNEIIRLLEGEVENLKRQNAFVKAENMELVSKQKVNENTTAFSSVDLLKRISRLEKEVFKDQK
ncbi:MAG: DivIVA domain-containing protein [Erysipelotrichaceae bacterium]